MGRGEATGGAGRSRGLPGRVLGCMPRAPGVYRFLDRRGQVLYIGRAASLRARVGSYWGDLGDRPQLAPMVPRVHRIEVVACESEHEAWWLERNLLEEHLPPYNRTAGGQEVPTFVVLHRARSALRLSVTAIPRPSPATVIFGPFLGAARVRAAIAGLHRVYPLGFTETAGAPLARELAAARGVPAAAASDLSSTP